MKHLFEKIRKFFFQQKPQMKEVLEPNEIFDETIVNNPKIIENVKSILKEAEIQRIFGIKIKCYPDYSKWFGELNSEDICNGEQVLLWTEDNKGSYWNLIVDEEGDIVYNHFNRKPKLSKFKMFHAEGDFDFSEIAKLLICQ